MARQRLQDIKVQGFVVPQKIKQIINAVSKISKQTSKWFKQNFDYSKLIKSFAQRIRSLFQFKAVDNLISSLRQGFNKAYSSISEGFFSSKTGLGQWRKWFENQFKSVGKSIGRQIAVDIKTVSQQFFGWFDKNKTHINDLLNGFAKQVGHILAKFAKGVMLIAQKTKDVLKLIDRLPKGIKRIMYSVAAVWAILKAGSLGTLIALVAFAGDLIKDYQNYLENKKNRSQYGDADYIDVAFKGVWQVLSSQDSASDKASKIANILWNGVAKLLSMAIGIDGKDIISGATNVVEGLKKAIKKAGNILSFLGGYKKQFSTLWSQMLSFMLDVVKLAFQSVERITSAIVDGFLLAISNTQNPQDWKRQFAGKGNSIFAAIASGFIASLAGASPAISIMTAIFSFLSNKPVDENGNETQWNSETLSAQAYMFIQKVLWLIVGAFTIIDDVIDPIVTVLLEVIGQAFSGTTIGQALGISSQKLSPERVQKNKSAMKSIVEGLFGGLTAFILSGGDTLKTILFSVIGLFSQSIVDAFNEATENGTKSIDWKKFYETLGQSALETVDDVKYFLLVILDIILNYSAQGNSIIADKLFGWMSEVMNIEQGSAGYNNIKRGMETLVSFVVPSLVSVVSGKGIVSGLISGVVSSAFTVLGQAKKQVIDDDGNMKSMEEYTQVDWNTLFTASASQIQSLASDLFSTIQVIIRYIESKWNEQGGWRDSLLLMWQGEDGNGGFKSNLTWVWEGIQKGFEWVFRGLWKFFKPAFTALMIAINNALYSNKLITFVLQEGGIARRDTIVTEQEGKLTFNTPGVGEYVYEYDPEDTMTNGQLIVESLIPFLKKYGAVAVDSTGLMLQLNQQQFNNLAKNGLIDNIAQSAAKNGTVGVGAYALSVAVKKIINGVFGDRRQYIFNSLDRAFRSIIQTKDASALGVTQRTLEILDERSLDKDVARQKIIKSKWLNWIQYGNGQEAQSVFAANLGNMTSVYEFNYGVSATAFDLLRLAKMNGVFDGYDSSTQQGRKQIFNAITDWMIRAGFVDSNEQLLQIMIPDDNKGPVYESNPFVFLLQNELALPQVLQILNSTDQQLRSQLQQSFYNECFDMTTYDWVKNTGLGNGNSTYAGGVDTTYKIVVLDPVFDFDNQIFSFDENGNVIFSGSGWSFDQNGNLNGFYDGQTFIPVGPSKSQGGRVNGAVQTLVGQDGPQYIIPVNKPQRAKDLIGDMISELPQGAKVSLANAFGFSMEEGTIGQQIAKGSTIEGITKTTLRITKNVDAKLVINVQSSNASAKSVGNAIYSAANGSIASSMQKLFG